MKVQLIVLQRYASALGYAVGCDLKEVVAEQTLELRLLKKSMFDGGGGPE